MTIRRKARILQKNLDQTWLKIFRKTSQENSHGYSTGVSNTNPTDEN